MPTINPQRTQVLMDLLNQGRYFSLLGMAAGGQDPLPLKFLQEGD